MPKSKSKRSRYTPPAPTKPGPSPMWVPAAMFTFMGVGIVIIITNYFDLLPGDDPLNRYLMLGLVLIMGGFAVATRVR